MQDPSEEEERDGAGAPVEVSSDGPSRLVWPVAVVLGLLWPAVTIVSTTVFAAPFHKSAGWETGETLAVFLVAFLVAAVPVLPVAPLLRALRVRHPWKTAVAGLLFASPASTYAMAGPVGDLVGGEAVTFVLALLSSAALFPLMVRLSQRTRWLRCAMSAGAAALVAVLVLAVTQFVASSREVALRQFEDSFDTMVLLDDDGWARTSVRASPEHVGATYHYVEITYHSTGPEPRALVVSGYSEDANPDYMDFDDPCEGRDRAACEERDVGIIRRTGDGPELITRYEGVHVVITAPAWEPKARVPDLVGAGEHLRRPSRAEWEAVRSEGVRQAVWYDVPGGLRPPTTGAGRPADE